MFACTIIQFPDIKVLNFSFSTERGENGLGRESSAEAEFMGFGNSFDH